MNGSQPSHDAASLRARLSYEPVGLKFGTSGRRGRVVDLSQLEVYLNVLGEVHYLQSQPAAAGGISRGEEFYVACDLRPSSTTFIPEQEGRGELTQVVIRALRDGGMKPVFLGPLPTPALAAYAFKRRCASIMVTGSHIPLTAMVTRPTPPGANSGRKTKPRSKTGWKPCAARSTHRPPPSLRSMNEGCSGAATSTCRARWRRLGRSISDVIRASSLRTRSRGCVCWFTSTPRLAATCSRKS